MRRLLLTTIASAGLAAVCACPAAKQPQAAPVGPAGALPVVAPQAASMPASMPAAVVQPAGTAGGAASAPAAGAAAGGAATIIKGESGAAAGAPKKLYTGTIVETMDATSYTYVRVKTGEGEIWAAVGKTAVKVGEKISINESLTMTDFESKTLKRTFSSIVFGTIAR